MEIIAPTLEQGVFRYQDILGLIPWYLGAGALYLFTRVTNLFVSLPCGCDNPSLISIRTMLGKLPLSIAIALCIIISVFSIIVWPYSLFQLFMQRFHNASS